MQGQIEGRIRIKNVEREKCREREMETMERKQRGNNFQFLLSA
jgi:hypothetical protein